MMHLAGASREAGSQPREELRVIEGQTSEEVRAIYGGIKAAARTGNKMLRFRAAPAGWLLDPSKGVHYLIEAPSSLVTLYS